MFYKRVCISHICPPPSQPIRDNLAYVPVELKSQELSSPQLRPASGYYLSSPLAALLWAALLQHHHPSLVLVNCLCAAHHTLGRPSGHYPLLAIKRPGAVSLTAAHKSKMRKGKILPYPE